MKVQSGEVKINFQVRVLILTTCCNVWCYTLVLESASHVQALSESHFKPCQWSASLAQHVLGAGFCFINCWGIIAKIRIVPTQALPPHDPAIPFLLYTSRVRENTGCTISFFYSCIAHFGKLTSASIFIVSWTSPAATSSAFAATINFALRCALEYHCCSLEDCDPFWWPYTRASFLSRVWAISLWAKEEEQQ